MARTVSTVLLPGSAGRLDQVPILLALASAIVYGVADYAGGRATRRLPSLTVAFVGQLCSIALVLVLVAAMGTPLPDGRTLAWGAGAGAAASLALVAFYHALSKGSMTTVAPLTAVVGATLPVCVGLVSGERPRAIAYVGIGLAIVAVALVSGAGGHRAARAPRFIVLLAVLAGLGFGALFVAFDQVADGSGAWPLLAARAASVPLLGALGWRSGALRGRSGPKVRGLGLPALVGVLDMGANALYLWASKGGLLSIVAVVGSLYPAATVTLAYVVDGERLHRPQWIGMAAAAGALVLVTLGRA
jgi:drug/metabolite transporter (DMT)-like permease